MKVVEFQEMLCMHEETDAVFVINLHTRGFYNLEKVLNVISQFEKSLNSVKVLYQVLKSPRISLLFISNAISVLQIQLQVIPSDCCHFAKFCYGK